jgi:1D-myo-inositol 3-kinase
LIRVIDSNGNVSLNSLDKTPFYSLLNRISFLKASRQEALCLDLKEVRKRTCVLVTEGSEGCTVYLRNTEFRIPSFPAAEVDPTGAGDSFLAGFSVGLLKNLPVEKSVLLGNYLGSLAVQQVGVPKLNSQMLQDFLGELSSEPGLTRLVLWPPEIPARCENFGASRGSECL